MKNIIPFVAILILFSSGCKKIDKLTQFEIEYDVSVVIPSNTTLNLPINTLTPDMETNATSTFAANDTRKDLIEEIRLTKMELTLTTPSDGSFNFLESIGIYISADDVAEKEIAFKENVSDSGVRFLALDVSNVDLQSYIKKDEFQLRIQSVTDESINSDHRIDVHSVFFVDAKVLGQ